MRSLNLEGISGYFFSKPKNLNSTMSTAMADPRQDCFWTLVVQSPWCQAEFGATLAKLPASVLLTDCGDFVSKNKITIPMAHNKDAKILVAKGRRGVVN